MSFLTKTRSALAQAARSVRTSWARTTTITGASALNEPAQSRGCGCRFHSSGCNCSGGAGGSGESTAAANGIAERFFSVMPNANQSQPSTATAGWPVNGAYDTAKLSTTAANRDIANLLENNKKWVAEMKEKDPNFFDRLGAGQAPKYLYVGCSDSRVPANEIIGLPPGQVFVHRNIGNLVVGTDLNVLSVIDYAVDFLDVQHIIVTGHYDCGAVKAAVENTDIGLVENWLRNIRDVYRLHFREVDAIKDDNERHRKLVQLNVVEQCLNMYKNGTVQRKRQRTFRETGSAYPRIHGLVFDPADGVLHKLPVNFGETMADMRHVYDLYDVKSKGKAEDIE